MGKNLQRFLDAERRAWDEVGVAPTEHRVTLPSGGTVRVQEVGRGVPMVFLHGGSVAGTSWSLLASKLEGIRCILVDRPGCGLSDPIVGGPLRDLAEVNAYADRLLPELLDALDLDTAAVGATSYGGIFAFRGAAAAPDRIERLVEYSWLVGAPGESAPIAARIGALPGMQGLAARMPMTRSMVKAALRQFGLGRAIESGAFTDTMLDWAYELLRNTDTMANDIRSSPKLVRPISGFNKAVVLSDDLLARLQMPILLLWGADDPNGGAAIATDFASRLPDATLEILPGAEHAPWLDDLERCASRTREFLDA